MEKEVALQLQAKMQEKEQEEMNKEDNEKVTSDLPTCPVPIRIHVRRDIFKNNVGEEESRSLLEEDAEVKEESIALEEENVVAEASMSLLANNDAD